MGRLQLLLLLVLIGTSIHAAADAPAPCTGETYTFLVEVTSPNGKAETVEGVIAYDGQLEIINETTPYSVEFAAARLIAMFNSNAKVTASLYVRDEGETELVGNISDRRAAIYESVSCTEPLLRVFGRY